MNEMKRRSICLMRLEMISTILAGATGGLGEVVCGDGGVCGEAVACVVSPQEH